MTLTDNPDDPRLRRSHPFERTMQEAYLVLSEEERAKGFVRPVWKSYVHIGQVICGDITYQLETDPGPGLIWACADQPGHDWPHDDLPKWSVWQKCTPKEAAQGRIGGCGTITTIAREIAETYARNPKFYGSTYCSYCRTHLPVGSNGQFFWVDDEGFQLPVKVGE